MSKNWKDIEHRIYTMCMIQRNNEVLLIQRPDHLGSPGFIGRFSRKYRSGC